MILQPIIAFTCLQNSEIRLHNSHVRIVFDNTKACEQQVLDLKLVIAYKDMGTFTFERQVNILEDYSTVLRNNTAYFKLPEPNVTSVEFFYLTGFEEWQEIPFTQRQLINGEAYKELVMQQESEKAQNKSFAMQIQDRQTNKRKNKNQSPVENIPTEQKKPEISVWKLVIKYSRIALAIVSIILIIYAIGL
ncbi:Hypothetical_protein [Hexamita inflata]|uniref:Hypothetical_protein n=1 Tax=Hexamita inflata TaxID=28002 RepID=A0ABP1HIG2_9EUKA